MRNAILFYDKNQPYYQFSNFYPCQIELDGYKWATAEHYFLAQKYVDNPAYYKKIREAKTPGLAFSLARKRVKGLRENWDTVRIDVMYKALKAKFRQNEHCKAVLLGTEDWELVEHTDKDKFWADGGVKQNGVNMLGKLLMKVRSEIRQEEANKKCT